MKAALVTLGLAGLIVLPVTAQQDDHQMPADVTIDACREQSQQAVIVIDAADRRLELARQTNNPSQMRAAVDALQADLGKLKTQLAPCAAAVETSAGNAMPGMQHNMAGMPHAMPGAPAVSVAPAADAAGSSGSTNAAVAADVQSRNPSAPTAQAAATSLGITLKTQPMPPKTGENQFEVMVRRPDGKPVTGAEVSIVFVMPAMPAMKMPEMRNEIKLKAAVKPAPEGTYSGSGQVMMAGQWNVTVSVKQNGKEIGQKKLTVTTR